MSKEVQFRDLVLITKYFPFNMGDVPAESYLEEEVGILSDIFENVYVFAVDAPADRELCQAIPRNARAFPLGIASNRGRKVRLLLSSLLPVRRQNRKYYKLVRQAEESMDSFGKLILFRYAFNKAEVYRKTIELIVEHDNLRVDGALFYSFWLFDTALSVVRLANAFDGLAMSRAHRYDLYENQNVFGYLPFRRYLGDKLDVIAPCSKDGMKYLVFEEGYPLQKTHLSYLGTNDLGYVELSVCDVPLVVSCSTLTKVKRVPLIAAAMKILDEEGFLVRWRHYGAGPEMGIVQSNINQLNIIDAKLMGSFDHKDLMRVYRDDPPHLFVNVSSSEGLPISIMEACSLGTPVICTDVGGSSEIVSEKNGALLDANSSAREIADAIRRVLGMDAHSYRKLRVGSRLAWESKFDASANVRSLFSILMERGR